MQGWMYQQDQNNLLETQLGFSDSAPAWIRSEYLTKRHLVTFIQIPPPGRSLLLQFSQSDLPFSGVFPAAGLWFLLYLLVRPSLPA